MLGGAGGVGAFGEKNDFFGTRYNVDERPGPNEGKKNNFEDKILKKNPQILILLLGQSNGRVHFSTGVEVNL